MIQWAYVAAGGDAKKQELDERFKVTESLRRANDRQVLILSVGVACIEVFYRMYKEVPFGAAGIRTAADLVADDDAGPGGVAYDRSK